VEAAEAATTVTKRATLLVNAPSPNHRQRAEGGGGGGGYNNRY